MRFLLRMMFWLGVIVVLLPRGESQPAPNASVSAIGAMSAATATVGDMRQFCERQPEACKWRHKPSWNGWAALWPRSN